jgi:cell division protein FtsB
MSTILIATTAWLIFNAVLGAGAYLAYRHRSRALERAFASEVERMVRAAERHANRAPQHTG